MMGEWTDAVEEKARVIHAQLSAARRLAEGNGGDLDFISAPYFELLRSLYEDEFAFAQLADTSDLIARFTGPAVRMHEPSVTIVAGVFTDLRNQVRGIAKSIVGLLDRPGLRWPSELDPHLAGIAHGSLIVGVSLPHPDEDDAQGQANIPGVSDEIYRSVRAAVQSLTNIARYIDENKINDGIHDAFPDPAVRDTVMVAASRLAPSGRKGIDSVAFLGPEHNEDSLAELTPNSRRILNHSLSKPVRVSGSGTFEGIVREIDLDAHRFEIRRVREAGAIRCVYGPEKHDLVRTILDAHIRVNGNYEALENAQPRLIQVDSISVIRAPELQLQFTALKDKSVLPRIEQE